jgi:hypothetical protein
MASFDETSCSGCDTFDLEIRSPSHKWIKPSRTCRYCDSRAELGQCCDHCGSPDDGQRGPLKMAPMNVAMA